MKSHELVVFWFTCKHTIMLNVQHIVVGCESCLQTKYFVNIAIKWSIKAHVCSKPRQSFSALQKFERNLILMKCHFLPGGFWFGNSLQMFSVILPQTVISYCYTTKYLDYYLEHILLLWLTDNRVVTVKSIDSRFQAKNTIWHMLTKKTHSNMFL